MSIFFFFQISWNYYSELSCSSLNFPTIIILDSSLDILQVPCPEYHLVLMQVIFPIFFSCSFVLSLINAHAIFTFSDYIIFFRLFSAEDILRCFLQDTEVKRSV